MVFFTYDISDQRGGGSANAELPEKGGWRGSAISDLPDFLLSFTVLDDL